MRSPLPRAATALICATVTLSLAACGSGESGSPEDAAAAASSPATDYYPRTVTTRYGDVEISAAPQRVVALSLASAEELLALGVTPVAVASTPESLASTTPWIAEQLAGLTDPDLAPERVAAPEAIAELDPDLVVGKNYNFADKNGFDQVNSIAPTVLPDSEENNVDWNDRLLATAEAVNATDKAESVIAEVTGELRAAGDKVPGIEKKTYNWVAFGGDYFSFGNGASFELFGLQPARSQSGTRTGDRLSLENTGELDADLLIVFARKESDRVMLDADQAFQDLPAVKNGTLLYLDTAGATAVNEPGPYSLRWILGELTPALDKLAV